MERACTILLVPLIALGAILIGSYSFGTDDQAQYLVQVLAIENPDAFPRDLYPPVFTSLGSLFWYPITWLSTEANRPAIILTITLAITLLNVELLRRLGKVLLGSGLWSFLPALLLVVPKERNWFGLVGFCDYELTATMGVLPLVFGSLLAWVRGRPFWALLLATLAVPIHAQTGAALLVTWWTAVTLLAIHTPRWRPVSVIVGAIGLGSVLLALFALRLPPETRDLCRAAGDDLFAALIDPLAAAPKSWAAVGVLLLLGLLAALRSFSSCPLSSSFLSCLRSGSLPRAPRGRAGEGVPSGFCHAGSSLALRALIWTLASLAFPLGGTALHALGLDEPLLWRLMVGRGFLLPQVGAILLIAIWARHHTGSLSTAITAFVLLALAWWPFAEMPVPLAAVGLGFVALAILARPSPKKTEPPASQPTPSPLPVLAAILPLTILALLGIPPARWLDTHADPAWREAQTWARHNTSADTLFITPPYLTGWRLESLRTTFGEGKDGGLAFYADDRVLDWDRRMDLVALSRPCNWELWEAATIANTQANPTQSNHPLTASLFAEYTTARDNYHAALRANLDAIFAEFGTSPEPEAVYLVTEADLGLGKVLWHNDRFWITQVSHFGRPHNQ